MPYIYRIHMERKKNKLAFVISTTKLQRSYSLAQVGASSSDWDLLGYPTACCPTHVHLLEHLVASHIAVNACVRYLSSSVYSRLQFHPKASLWWDSRVCRKFPLLAWITLAISPWKTKHCRGRMKACEQHRAHFLSGWQEEQIEPLNSKCQKKNS